MAGVGFNVLPQAQGKVTYLQMAPAQPGGQVNCLLCFRFDITNGTSGGIVVTSVKVEFPGTSAAAKTFPVSWQLAAGAMYNFAMPAENDIVIAAVSPSQIKFTLSGTGFTAVSKQWAAAPHESPTPQKSYRFYAKVADLAPGEFWMTSSSVHGVSGYGSQLFAYDVYVENWDEDKNQWSELYPGLDRSKNDNFRIYGKPVYAVADGTIEDFQNDFPTNEVPGTQDPDIQKRWANDPQSPDGNGNYVALRVGSEIVMYAHLQTGSIPAHVRKGVSVKAGDLLGQVGNSGASGGPHLHIHSSGPLPVSGNYWEGAPNPLPFHNAQVIDADVLKNKGAPNVQWVKLNGRGIPNKFSAVWPSDGPAVALRRVKIGHFAITPNGQCWAIELPLMAAAPFSRILTTTDRLPNHGLFFDVEPGGTAKEVAATGSKPYVIGTNLRVFEGLPNGWSELAGSPKCKRITVDQNDGDVWVITDGHHVRRFDSASRTWVAVPGGGTGKDVCVHAGTAYLIGSDDFIYKNTGQGWQQLPGAGRGKRIAIDPASQAVWVIGMNDGIWRYKGGGNWEEHAGGGKGKEIAICKGRPYVIGQDDKLWGSVGSAGWARINLVATRD